MPLHAIRALTFGQRTRHSNRRLGALLAFVAGAVNAGGFLVVHRYVSHMTGIVSSIGDEWVAGRARQAWVAVLFVAVFLAGAFSTSVLVNWARRRGHRFEYAVPLALEAVLLAGFVALGSSLARAPDADATFIAALLCYVMGLQNALVTKISRAEIRTTHVTGLVTDIGIELGRLAARRADSRDVTSVAVDRERLLTHGLLLGMFLGGGIAGAFAVRAWGVAALWPLIALLALVAAPALLADAARRPREGD